MNYLVNKFAEDVNNDTYNNITTAEAKEILSYEIDGFGETPKYILNGNITAFRCSWSVYTEEELVNDFSYMVDTSDAEDEEELAELIFSELQDQTQGIKLSNNNYAIGEF